MYVSMLVLYKSTPVAIGYLQPFYIHVHVAIVYVLYMY